MIKDNREFIKVFKNTKICGRKIDFKDILFLFDEIDIELEKLLDNNKEDNKIIKKLKKKYKRKLRNKKMTSVSDDDSDSSDSEDNMLSCVNLKNSEEFTLGTILEEMNGINQMYGRIMILITNNYEKLINIHHGALIRPGRVDRIYEFKNCSINSIIELLTKFYQKNISNNQFKQLQQFDSKFTAAKLVNLCKISKTIDEVILKLRDTL